VSALAAGVLAVPAVVPVSVPVSVAAQTVLDGSLLLAVPLALLAGLVSFASPCVLPLVPGYLAYVSGLAAPDPDRVPVTSGAPAGAPTAAPTAAATAAPTAAATAAPTAAPAPSGAPALLADPEAVPTGRLVLGTSLFVAGFSAVFVALATVAGAAGAVLPRARLVDVVAGVLAIGLGLVFVGAVRFLRTERRPRWRPAVGLAGAPLLGAAFGVGWVPCVGPTLGAVLILAGTEGGAERGALLGVAYCVGLGLPFVLVSLGYARGLRALGPLRRHRVLITRIGGALMVLTGLLLVTGAWDAMVELLRGPISRFPVLL
jgi:cytochrome c-type biogenesis protein